jgi:hypothetical protein
MTYAPRKLFTTLVPAFALFAVGCGDDASDRVSELTAPVAAAIASPSGEVNEITAPRVLDEQAAQNTVNEASAFVPMAGGVSASPQALGGHPCIDGDDESGSYDMGCLSGGQVSGTVEYEMDQEDGTQYFLMDYVDVCVSGSCVNGTMAMQFDGNALGLNYNMLVAGELTVTADGQSLTMKYGYKMSMSGGQAVIEYVVWVDGKSYVLSASAGVSGGSMMIRGNNGSFSCSYDQATGGSCSGDADFSWEGGATP